MSFLVLFEFLQKLLLGLDWDATASTRLRNLVLWVLGIAFLLLLLLLKLVVLVLVELLVFVRLILAAA